jgi:hypothetical protein
VATVKVPPRTTITLQNTNPVCPNSPGIRGMSVKSRKDHRFVAFDQIAFGRTPS